MMAILIRPHKPRAPPKGLNHSYSLLGASIRTTRENTGTSGTISVISATLRTFKLFAVHAITHAATFRGDKHCVCLKENRFKKKKKLLDALTSCKVHKKMRVHRPLQQPIVLAEPVDKDWRKAGKPV